MLDLYVVYKRPKDYPDSYVVRQWRVSGAGRTLVAKEPLIVTEDLAKARAKIPEGLVRLERAAADDPCILEVWF